MLAIPNSLGLQPIAKVLASGYIGLFSWGQALSLVAALIVVDPSFFLAASGQSLVTNTPPTAAPIGGMDGVRRGFDVARTAFQSRTNDAEVTWQFGRACFDLADATSNKTERAQIAELGIGACRRSIGLASNSAAPHYYLGMNIGQLADTRRNLSALRMVKDMEREFLTARNQEERFDYAGPDRNLGLLYLQAPAFMSIGNRGKARQHLQRAVDLAPEYPENRLLLIEALLKWGGMNEARSEVKLLHKFRPEARKTFSGDKWDASWRDWERRLKAVEKKLEQESKTLESPHEQN